MYLVSYYLLAFKMTRCKFENLQGFAFVTFFKQATSRLKISSVSCVIKFGFLFLTFNNTTILPFELEVKL